ncbi:hypothetical protein AMTRI_Chr08g201900 [Amborella trichopoda]
MPNKCLYLYSCPAFWDMQSHVLTPVSTSVSVSISWHLRNQASNLHYEQIFLNVSPTRCTKPNHSTWDKGGKAFCSSDLSPKISIFYMQEAQHSVAIDPAPNAP